MHHCLPQLQSLCRHFFKHGVTFNQMDQSLQSTNLFQHQTTPQGGSVMANVKVARSSFFKPRFPQGGFNQWTSSPPTEKLGTERPSFPTFGNQGRGQHIFSILGPNLKSFGGITVFQTRIDLLRKARHDISNVLAQDTSINNLSIKVRRTNPPETRITPIRKREPSP